ncbi:response regulator transcription factor [Paenibacillus prosopidis]|uniref:Two-component system response regulator YesN n=1 Tax=Paenibacillus prosopidis TaxID=630520 RepID=A0A368W9K4_9BACL|nr:response regulator [Paenibacillus prosopidis]RCW51756.1 two-component system response regulator YesN [Paenibacillus prosopidis]
MYSVLLVDDEAIELETMVQYVPWEQAGIRVAGTARNGKEAVGKLTELKPDIIITDVRMPIMDGLEFGRRAKQIDKSVKLIYLSGHNEFQYIKSALNIEAAGYVLKPIDMEELLALLEKVKRKCDEEQLAGQGGGWLLEKLLLRIVREPLAERRLEWIRQWESRADGFTAHQPFGAAYITFEQPAFPHGMKAAVEALREAGDGVAGTEFEGYTGAELAYDAAETARAVLKPRLDASIVLETGVNTLFVMFQGKPQQWETAYWELLREELSQATGGHAELTIGLSGPYKGFQLLKEAYEASRRCNDEKLYRQAGTVISPGTAASATQSDMNAELAFASLIAAIQSANAERTGQALDDWFTGMRQERTERNYAVRASIQLLTALEQHFTALMAGSARDHLLADHWKELSSLPTIAHFHAYTLRFCGELLKAASERDLDRNQSVADQITKLIADRYHLPITVEDIAKEVYLSPNYVRSIFKEKTGETILDYLTRIRMGHASKLLKDRSLKVREIAHKVGYENVSYFCSVFQRHKGSTPNEYRKMHL